MEDALVISLRPRACDLRRLRFSRNASFSRSCLEFFAGSFFRKHAALTLALMLVILHRGPVPNALRPGTYRRTSRWRLCRDGPRQAGIAWIASGDPEILRAVCNRQNILCCARRSCNCRSRQGAVLEFAANIGKWQLKGIAPIKFNDAGEMIEFEVMIRPSRRWLKRTGNRIGPQPTQMKAVASPPALILAVFDGQPGSSRACARGRLVARIGPPCRGPFWPILLSGHAAVAQW